MSRTIEELKSCPKCKGGDPSGNCEWNNCWCDCHDSGKSVPVDLQTAVLSSQRNLEKIRGTWDAEQRRYIR